MLDIITTYSIVLILLLALVVICSTLENSSISPVPLTTRIAGFLFNLAWSIDYREVSRIIESDCEYVHIDEAYEYVCANMGD